MSWLDGFRLAWGAVAAHRLRSALTMLGILIGIASVILLTSIGEGTRRYILAEFMQFGTNLLQINPGKTLTTGQPGALAGTFRKLTIDDMDAIRRIPGVENVVPLVFGTARVELGERGRSVFIYGVNSAVPDVWKFRIGQGRFLPPGDPRRGGALTVLGPTLKRELFGDDNALGKYVRVGGRRFLVIGVMEAKGQFLGIDIDDSAYIPVASAQEIFDQNGLWEIDVTFTPLLETAVVEGIRRVLIERHGGEEDFAITTQSDALSVMDRVLGVVSLAGGAIGGISLVVGAIGILTMMWISVNERTGEIGLAKAIGASSFQILALYLSEAAVLSLAGGGLGLATGFGVATLLRWAIPGLPVHTPLRYVFAALAVSLAVGLASGALPALRASRLDPVQALRAE
jgi:putative ABC transport system permease protein